MKQQQKKKTKGKLRKSVTTKRGYIQAQHTWIAPNGTKVIKVYRLQ